MVEPIEVRPGVLVPAEAMSFRAVRAGGPGGQNVNKVASKVELTVDLGRIQGLDPSAAARLHAACRHSLDAEGTQPIAILRRNEGKPRVQSLAGPQDIKAR